MLITNFYFRKMLSVFKIFVNKVIRKLLHIQYVSYYCHSFTCCNGKRPRVMAILCITATNQHFSFYTWPHLLNVVSFNNWFNYQWTHCRFHEQPANRNIDKWYICKLIWWNKAVLWLASFVKAKITCRWEIWWLVEIAPDKLCLQAAVQYYAFEQCLKIAHYV